MKTVIAYKRDQEYYLPMSEWVTLGITSIPKCERTVAVKGGRVFMPAPNAESVWTGKAMGARMLYQDDDYWIESEWLSEWYLEEKDSHEMSDAVDEYARSILALISWSKEHSLRLYKMKQENKNR